MSWIRRRAVRCWLELLFWLTVRAPIVLRVLGPVLMFLTWRCAGGLRDAVTANARRILGPSSTLNDQRSLGRRVVVSAFENVVDFGRHRRLPVETLLSRIESVEGLEGYERARKLGRGAILVTAHLGPFEIALSSVMQRERSVHVVFRRDAMSVFERLRSEHRHRLGVREAPIDDGLLVWFRLRDALLADEVVLLQGDRTMPGQRGAAVPFLHGHLRVPEGPVKLARITGSPIIPTFAIWTPGKRVRIELREPLLVGGSDPVALTPEAALGRLATEIADVVSRYPEQWLVLERAWIEDRGEQLS